MPSLTVRSYHPESGALLGNISTLDFGIVTLGTHSSVKVIDIAFDDTTVVGNLKVGLISSGGITVSSSGSKHFGIGWSADFNATMASGPISDGTNAMHFSGTNATGTASDSNNIAVPMRSNTLSDYIYLDIELGSTNLAAGNGAYKIFFDYT